MRRFGLVKRLSCSGSPSIFNTFSNEFLGDPSEEVPPVPIPNTEVKLLSPDGTARASVWESRKLPELKSKSPPGTGGLFAFRGRSLNTVVWLYGKT